MNTLLPIIRRKRRPLIVEEQPPVAAPVKSTLPLPDGKNEKETNREKTADNKTDSVVDPEA